MDNFDLKKFLKESKALQNLNPLLAESGGGHYEEIIKVNNYNAEEAYDYLESQDLSTMEINSIITNIFGEDLDESKGMDMDGMRKKIREMILAELTNPEDDYEGSSEEYLYGDYANDEMGYYPSMQDLEDEPIEYDLEEAKKEKDEEEEEVEVTDTETEDEIPAEETPATSGGLEDVAANMEGTESELMDHLMNALKIAKGMNNEKLETQVGNTLKFFVSEYIGGRE
jgi:hypothetical protein